MYSHVTEGLDTHAAERVAGVIFGPPAAIGSGWLADRGPHCRHYFATSVVKLTRDVLLVRDLLDHASLTTTQIYMQSSIDGAQERLAAFSASASLLIDQSKPLNGFRQNDMSGPVVAL